MKNTMVAFLIMVDVVGCGAQSDTTPVGNVRGAADQAQDKVGFVGGPAKDSAQGAKAISTGGDHSCVVSGGGGVMCWGSNESGELGDGTTTDRHTAVDVAGMGPGSGVLAVAAASHHTCALLSSGGVKCWGSNLVGELGDGTTVDRHTPVDVYGLASGVIAIAAGGGHTCALLSGGTLMCWGANSAGELGNGTTNDSWWPREVRLDDVVTSVATGSGHTCALTSAGRVKCWGNNADGELGIGDRNGPYTLPMDVTGLTSGVTAITAGFNHTCAILKPGHYVQCWGYNAQGQLGDGTTIDRLTPVTVTGLDFIEFVEAATAGTDRTCIIATGNTLFCWGWNYSGAIGDGTTIDRAHPVEVVGNADPFAVSTGETHTCALGALHRVKCWGRNHLGQLGDGTTTDRLTPTDVQGL